MDFSVSLVCGGQSWACCVLLLALRLFTEHDNNVLQGLLSNIEADWAGVVTPQSKTVRSE